MLEVSQRPEEPFVERVCGETFPPHSRILEQTGAVNCEEALDVAFNGAAKVNSILINGLRKQPKNKAMLCDWRMTAISGRSEAYHPQSFPQLRWTMPSRHLQTAGTAAAPDDSQP